MKETAIDKRETLFNELYELSFRYPELHTLQYIPNTNPNIQRLISKYGLKKILDATSRGIYSATDTWFRLNEESFVIISVTDELYRQSILKMESWIRKVHANATSSDE